MRDLIEVRDKATGKTLTSSGNRKPGDAGKGDGWASRLNKKAWDEGYDKIDWSK